MNKIKIRKNPNGDTRTAPKDVTFEQFQQANDMHIEDVRNAMNYLSTLVKNRGTTHDYTKKLSEQYFYSDFLSTMNDGTDFTKGGWYQYHINKERHHLLSRCPDDVNLIDVLEMIADCVCAGLARSGEVRDLEINTDILERAVVNTVNLLKSNIELKKDTLPYTHILLHYKDAVKLHRDFGRLYDALQLQLEASDNVRAMRSSFAKIDIYDRIRIDFRCGDICRCVGMRPNYFYADTYEAAEFIAQGAYKCDGKRLDNLSEILDIITELLKELD